MTLDDLIQLASNEPLKVADVERAAKDLGTAPDHLFDQVARIVGERYVGGQYSYGFCDAVMTAVFTFAHVTTDTGLSRFSMNTNGSSRRR